MAQSSTTFHESPDLLKPETMDRHRAIVSLMEELEAVDWYDQRLEAARDEELRAILAHNRDEEKEHAAMVLEWLRRRDPHWDEQLRNYLFADKPILEREEELDKQESAAGARTLGDGSLGIGSLRASAK
ncbi:MAG TPA: ferritin-like domain-containing protein [Burkholderiales bacterium]|nr:ferritin-like domain-containing protein [Burkholderiales bacterium]